MFEGLFLVAPPTELWALQLSVINGDRHKICPSKKMGEVRVDFPPPALTETWKLSDASCPSWLLKLHSKLSNKSSTLNVVMKVVRLFFHGSLAYGIHTPLTKSIVIVDWAQAAPTEIHPSINIAVKSLGGSFNERSAHQQEKSLFLTPG